MEGISKDGNKIQNYIRDRLFGKLKYLIYAFALTLVIFGVFMYARTIEDEHISGAFGLFPVAVILIIFFGLILFEFVREQKNKK
ncbi:MAG: hypothetical protein NZ927_01340 [Candidatus Calescibacterium sp.]|nr:hypothetical protein [Candidatus Calescibacterium sp.]MCX7733646.1 hypothetical protein [bacterium]MDW8087169.1 hypothetical protein [Candidatus Calescibacterium sp.]